MEEKQVPIKLGFTEAPRSQYDPLLCCSHRGWGAGGVQSRSFGISGLLNPLSDHQGGEKELLHPHKMTWGDSPAQTLVVADRVLMKVR